MSCYNYMLCLWSIISEITWQEVRYINCLPFFCKFGQLATWVAPHKAMWQNIPNGHKLKETNKTENEGTICWGWLPNQLSFNIFCSLMRTSSQTISLTSTKAKKLVYIILERRGSTKMHTERNKSSWSKCRSYMCVRWYLYFARST